MALFFKHILRSIKKRPTQPIVLVLTLTLSVMVSVCILSVREALFEERAMAYDANYGSADIMITLSSSAESRFMFTEDIRRILGDDCTVTGYYEVILSFGGGDIFSSAAVDFETVDEIFKLEFTEYSGLNDKNLKDSVFVSSQLAAKRGLSADDEFEAELLGIKKIYRVAGISNLEFFGQYDIIMDIGGVVDVLCEKYSFAAALGDAFRPCNTILLKIPDGDGISGAISALKSDAALSGTNIENVASNPYGEANEELLSTIIGFSVLLCCVIACAVVYSCFSILSAERQTENYSFKAAGAKASFLAFMQYAEALIYFAVSSVLGLALSLPFLMFVEGLLDFKYARLEANISVYVTAVLLLLFSVFASVSIFLVNKDRKKRHRARGAMLALFGAICVLLYLLTFLLPIDLKLAVGMGTLLLLLLFVFLSGERLLSFLAGAICKRRESLLIRRGKRTSPILLYSLKNLTSVGALRTIVRMISLLSAALLCICYLIFSLNGEISIIETVFDGDYIVLNGSRRCYERVAECESVSGVVRAYFSTGIHEKEMGTYLISTDNADILNDSFEIPYLPVGNEAIISYGEAEALSLKLGDSFKVRQSDVEIELRVAGIVKSGMPLILFDCAYFGIDYSMLFPETKTGFADGDMLKELSSITAEEVASVIKTESLCERIVHNMGIFLRSGSFLLAFISVFSLIGIVDTFLECYRSRRGEFALYRSAGATAREVVLIKLSEISISILSSLIIGAVGFLALAPLIDETMLSVCFDAPRCFAAWFRA